MNIEDDANTPESAFQHKKVRRELLRYGGWSISLTQRTEYPRPCPACTTGAVMRRQRDQDACQGYPWTPIDYMLRSDVPYAESVGIMGTLAAFTRGISERFTVAVHTSAHLFETTETAPTKDMPTFSHRYCTSTTFTGAPGLETQCTLSSR